jgi:lysophospholipase L1-like esterase
MATRILFALVLSATLAACGGGGDSPPQAVQAEQACRVSILLDGDSTMWGYAPGGGGARATTYPESELQRLMDVRFGAGVVTVRTGAVSGSTSYNADAQPVDADIVVYNSGINDAYVQMPLDVYAGNLRRFAARAGTVVLATPLPVSTRDDTAYSAAMLAVAAELGATVTDTRAYAISRTDWWQIATDGVHPSASGYALLAGEVLAPALVPMVESRCQDQVAR